MRQATINFIDDIDGSAAAETVHFMLHGVEYEIDLNEEHAGELREVFREHILKGRRVGGRVIRHQLGNDAPATMTTAASRDRARRVREWATENGIPVSPRGRLSVELLAQYEQAQLAPAESTPPKRRKRGTTSLARSTRRRATVAVRGA